MRLQLVNKEYNSEKLQDTPHRDLENTDLTAILRIYLPTLELGEATILVSDEFIISTGMVLFKQNSLGSYELRDKSV